MQLVPLVVDSSARFFKALGDPTRLRILALLSHGELCVCHIEKALSLPQPTASRHLGTLKSAGVVESRREGSWVYYRLAEQTDSACKKHLQFLVATFTARPGLKREIQDLRRSMGPKACS
jgi:ArsR family transcriptional regulator